MKKTIIIFLCSLCFSFHMPIISPIVNPEVLKNGFYKIDDLNLSPDTTYTVQNTSFSERIYILIFDSYAEPLQGVRLKPQSSNIQFSSSSTWI